MTVPSRRLCPDRLVVDGTSGREGDSRGRRQPLVGELGL